MPPHKSYKVKINDTLYHILKPKSAPMYCIYIDYYGKAHLEFTIRLPSPEEYKTNPGFLRNQCIKYFNLLDASESYDLPEEISIYDWENRFDYEVAKKNKLTNCFIEDFFVMEKKWFKKLERRYRNPNLLEKHLKEHSVYHCFQVDLIRKNK